VRSFNLKNRIVLAPMTRGRAGHAAEHLTGNAPSDYITMLAIKWQGVKK